MRNPRLLLYIALAVAIGGNLFRYEDETVSVPLPMVRSDFRACFPVSPGPIERPDHYSTHPHGRRKDVA